MKITDRDRYMVARRVDFYPAENSGKDVPRHASKTMYWKDCVACDGQASKPEYSDGLHWHHLGV